MILVIPWPTVEGTTGPEWWALPETVAHRKAFNMSKRCQRGKKMAAEMNQAFTICLRAGLTVLLQLGI